MFSELIESSKENFDEKYEAFLSQQPVISDVVREANKLIAERKLVEDKITQIRSEIKHVDMNISIEVIEDAERIEVLAQSIASNETKRIIVDGLKVLIEKYNVDIEILIRNNLSAYSGFLSLQKSTRECYRDYRTVMLAKTITDIISSELEHVTISREVNNEKLIEIVSEYISNNIQPNNDSDDTDIQYMSLFVCDGADTFRRINSNDGGASSFANKKRIAELTEIRKAMQ